MISDASVKMVRAAQRRLLDAAVAAGWPSVPGWMDDPGFRMACVVYDATMDRVPEWAEARAWAKAQQEAA